jgi:integrase
MASLHKQGGNRPGYKLRFRDTDNRQRVLWLGDVSKRNAETVARHVSELERATKAGVAPDVGTTKWASELTGRIRERLAVYGFVGSERKNLSGNATRMVGPFFHAYIATRTDWKSDTKYKVQQSADLFINYVGPNRLLVDVTASDVDAWRTWLLTSGKTLVGDDKEEKGLAVSTVNKIVKRVKQLFAQAVRARLLTESPASDQRVGLEVNRARDFYIDRATATNVLSECDTEWALIFGLCRYAGFRCPTEVLGLTWSDVDLATGRLRVDSVKTGLRFCPIFPELRPLLEEARYLAPDGATHCIRRYRGNETNLRSQLHRILGRAGVVPWPKAFVNLRASCRTDLQERFPDHVINTWLGHSAKVAERHYLQTTENHWQRAIGEESPSVINGGNAGGNIGANQTESSETTNAKIPGKSTPKGAGFSGILVLAPPGGLEPPTRGLTVRCSAD